MALDDVPRRAAGRLFATIDDELLLLDPVDGWLHVLSRTAALVYTSVDGTSSVAAIASAIGTEIGLSGDELIGDIIDALTSMHDEGLIAFTSSIIEGPTTAAPPGQAVGNGSFSPPMPIAELGGADCFEFGPVRTGAAAVWIRIAHPEVAALVAAPLALLPATPLGEPVDAVVTVVEEREGRFEVRLGDDVVATAESPDQAADAVLAGCNQAATTRPITAIRLHGAVVVCGESGAGKSSLVSRNSTRPSPRASAKSLNHPRRLATLARCRHLERLVSASHANHGPVRMPTAISVAAVVSSRPSTRASAVSTSSRARSRATAAAKKTPVNYPRV